MSDDRVGARTVAGVLLLVLTLLSAGCGVGGSSDATAAGCDAEDGGAEDGGGGGANGAYVIELYSGRSEIGPGSFAGGEVTVPASVVSTGLAEMEVGYMVDFAGRQGTTFSGRCYMVRQEDGRFRQKVLCGPADMSDGTSQWVSVPIAITMDGDDPIGFEHAPLITALSGIVPQPSSEEAANLVRPDGQTVELEDRSADSYLGAWTVESLEFTRVGSISEIDGLVVGQSYEASADGTSTVFSTDDVECPEGDSPEVVIEGDDPTRPTIDILLCGGTQLPASITEDDGSTLLLCWPEVGMTGEGCVRFART